MVFPFKIDRPTDLNRQIDLFRLILGYALLIGPTVMYSVQGIMVGSPSF